jgi:tetratricopeptide (TPR) repeat protein
VINLEVVDGRAQIGVYVTSPRSVQVCLELSTDTGKQLLYNQTENLSPEQAWQAQIPLPGNTLPQTLALRLYEASGKHSEAGHELLSYSPLPEEKPPIPAPASPAPPPDEVRSNEELFLHGQHLEQYRHATFAPEPYYEEALRRDPLDSRCNNALGLLLYRRGKFSQAEAYFRHAVERQTMRNPNPYDGEPFYNLGLALKMQGRLTEAYAAFYKATWNAAWQDAAYFELARLASRAGRVSEALALAELAIQRNARHFKARHLKIALLRHQGDPNSPNQNLPGRALDACNASLELDRLEYGALWEMRLLADSPAFEQYVRMHANTFIELALDYAHAGLYSDAVDLLSIAPQQDVLVHYTLGWVWLQAGNQAAALAEFQTAAKLPPDYCFPNRLEDVLSLQAAQSLNPADSRAPYYLGNFWYAHRQYEEAITCWEQACRLDPDFPTVHRNLGLAYYNKRKEPQRALESFELAFQKNPEDARVLFELDQLYKKLGRPPAMRLALLERYPSLVEQRDDLMIEQVALLNLLGRSEEALDMLCCRKFHPWEGGEGKVTNQYVASLVEISRRLIARGEYRQAIENLERARTYPANLGEGKLYGAQENNIFYYLGLAHQGMRDFERARQYYTLAARGPGEPSSTRYYNDQPPEMIFYQGLARQRLGEHVMAITIFQKLVDYGTAHLEDDIQMDYFAVSLPLFLVFEEDLSLQNRIHCYFMKALGYTGLGQQESALDSYAAVLALDANHLGATQHQWLIDSPGEPHPQAI